MKVLLAVDGSGHSEAAVNEISRQHFSPGTELRVISVVEPPHFAVSALEGVGSVGISERIEKDAHERARAAIDKAVTTLRADEGSRQLKVATKVLSGQAKAAILNDADDFGADLIVVGSHGHGKIGTFLLGSVAHSVALHAKCSVEIVRSPKATRGRSNKP